MIVSIRNQFGAASFETQTIRGVWEHEGQAYKDDLVRIFADVPDTPANRAWFLELKQRLKRDFQQIDIWIITHPSRSFEIDCLGHCLGGCLRLPGTVAHAGGGALPRNIGVNRTGSNDQTRSAGAQSSRSAGAGFLSLKEVRFEPKSNRSSRFAYSSRTSNWPIRIAAPIPKTTFTTRSAESANVGFRRRKNLHSSGANLRMQVSW